MSMTNNKDIEALLIKCADNHATEAEKKQAQELITNNETAALIWQQLQESQLPFKEAFEIELQPASDELVSTIENWQPMFFVGLAGGSLLTGQLSKSPDDSASASIAVADATSNLPEWVRLVADYHRLYARETVNNTQHQSIAAVSENMTELLSRTVSVPDLSSQLAEFRRMQVLSVDDNTLIQLVYLPENSNPIAVCILDATDVSQTDVATGLRANMRYAHWQNKQHAVVVVGEVSTDELTTIVDRVQKSLFSS